MYFGLAVAKKERMEKLAPEAPRPDTVGSRPPGRCGVLCMYLVQRRLMTEEMMP
jgi:hypothetical protein